MTTFGIVPEGFRIKPFDIIIEEMEIDARSRLGADINTLAASVLGQIFRITADQHAELWEAGAAVYRAGQRDGAEGEAQDALYALNEVLRLSAAASAVAGRLNLDAGAALPAGSVGRIGASGERWLTKAAVSNPEAFQDTVAAEFVSEVIGEIVGNAYSIDAIAVPSAGWNAKAAINTLNSETFPMAGGLTLDISVDEGPAQTITFLVGDFVDPALATAAELATKLSTLTGATAIDAGGFVRLVSDTDGPGSSIQILSGDANPILGFPLDLIRGMNPSLSGKNLCGNSEPYALVDNQRLFVKMDRGSTQTIILTAGQFPSGIGTAPARELAEAINASLVGGLAYEVGGKVQIESFAAGPNSVVEVTGGDANAAAGFQESVEFAGTTGNAAPGRATESDPAYRLRYGGVIRRRGSAMVEGIKADILLVSGVSSAFVYENPTDFTDSEGRLSHSVEAVVVGGDDTEIAEAMFKSVGGGIRTFRDPGSQGRTEPITDTNGVTHDINFNRPEDLQIFGEVDVVVNQNDFGAGDQAVGEQLVKEAVKDVGDSFGIGGDAIRSRLLCASLPAPTAPDTGVFGVTDVTDIRFDTIFVPVNTSNLPIDARQRATFAIVDIVVNVTFA